MKTPLWNKSGAWISKRRETEFAGPLPIVSLNSLTVKSAKIVQTRSTWSRANGCKIGEDTAKLHVTYLGGKVSRYSLSLDILTAKREAVGLLGVAPKPTTPVELTPAQAQKIGLVYHDADGAARGYCYCCGRAGFKVNAGRRLSRHGFQRPGWGYTFGECMGTRHTPERTLEIALASARKIAAGLAESLAGDLQKETRERLEFDLAAAKGRVYSQREVARLEAALAAPLVAKDLDETRRLLEAQEAANALWLERLEAVVLAADL